MLKAHENHNNDDDGGLVNSKLYNNMNIFNYKKNLYNTSKTELYTARSNLIYPSPQ